MAAIDNANVLTVHLFHDIAPQNIFKSELYSLLVEAQSHMCIGDLLNNTLNCKKSKYFPLKSART